MPPPCCMVSAASFTPSKMALRSSSILPRTKQLKRVTARPVPAPARMRPAGRKPRSAMASWKRLAHVSRAALAAFLDRGGGAGDAPERVVERRIDRRPSGCLQAVLEIPDVPGDRCWEVGCVRHAAVPASRPTNMGLGGAESQCNVLFMIRRCSCRYKRRGRASHVGEGRALKTVLHNFARRALNGPAGPLIECDTAAFAAPHFGFVLLVRLRVVATLAFEIQIDEVRHG